MELAFGVLLMRLEQGQSALQQCLQLRILGIRNECTTRSRMAPQDEGFVLFDVDNIPISAILRSLFTQEGTLPERSVAGGEAAPAGEEYLSTLPGGLLKAAWRSG